MPTSESIQRLEVFLAQEEQAPRPGFRSLCGDMRAVIAAAKDAERELHSRELHHFEVEIENEELRALIKGAPHDRHCSVWDSAGYMRVQNPTCTCFKKGVD